MPKGFFREKGVIPTNEMLASVLGDNKELWDEFLQYIESTFPNITTEWKFYGQTFGWSLVYSSKKKKLVYLTPAEPCFVVSFIFNDKGREFSKAAGFPDDVLQIIESGKTNPAGHSFDILIQKQDDIEIAKKLIQIKGVC